jgi:hypothetical protein
VISRVSLLTILLAVAGFGAATAPARTPEIGTAMFVVRQDPRLCPSPLCGGYWVALANGARTRCGGGVRRAQCYIAEAVDQRDGRLAGEIPDGALVRGVLEPGPPVSGTELDHLRIRALYAPAGSGDVAGGYYRVRDTGIRCVRAPCFSYRVTSVNGSVPVTTSAVDLAPSHASSGELDRALAAVGTKEGLYARGVFARSSDGGRVFTALRLYLRAPLPRA